MTRQSFNASSLLKMALRCFATQSLRRDQRPRLSNCAASIVEYRRAPESKPLRRQADTRRAVLVRPIQFSKNRPGPFGPPLSRARPSKRTRTPLGGGPKNRRFDRVQGNLTTLLRRLLAVNPLPAMPFRRATVPDFSKAAARSGVGTFRRGVRPGSPRTRGLGDIRRSRTGGSV
jgi:hypothetical protein